jgi:hypothetical protein
VYIRLPPDKPSKDELYDDQVGLTLLPPSPNAPDVFNGQWAKSSVKVSQHQKASSWLTWQTDLSGSTTISATSSKTVNKHTGMAQFCMPLITCKPIRK